ncbi:peptidoglycan-binding domain-containing protein [Leptothoe kymatousa]|uniref:Peptidoglycan-binding protein n=1 Tax=Leptothoe kymatousa TAU-MAC 1615 TaxID=2364775 RepID=A0ABS5Y1G0_9CYAN|nr:peptidoglycan-binding domain-containing protein [Leptothoe kymatousa]MBT9311636.1 peptidoglycan-binding protein [Leptothoe kymatousa TAU-MAC 1615]
MAALQEALSINGFDPGPIDGSYGPLTRDAVADFQRVYDLDETGVAGPDTLDVLGLYNTGDTVVANPPGGSSGRRSSSPYVAAITESSRKLPQVQQVFGNASIDSARPGRFINIGRYSSYSAASDRVREARRFGFDARILYQRR